jgi:hypothetical protein
MEMQMEQPMDGRYALALIRARKAAERRYHRATHRSERRTALRELVALKELVLAQRERPKGAKDEVARLQREAGR